MFGIRKAIFTCWITVWIMYRKKNKTRVALEQQRDDRHCSISFRFMASSWTILTPHPALIVVSSHAKVTAQHLAQTCFTLARCNMALLLNIQGMIQFLSFTQFLSQPTQQCVTFYNTKKWTIVRAKWLSKMYRPLFNSLELLICCVGSWDCTGGVCFSLCTVVSLVCKIVHFIRQLFTPWSIMQSQ